MANVRARIIVEGRVQGVFFRAHTQEMAELLELKGWVKNRRDGRVEALFEGDQKKVEQMIQWCHRGPPHAKVTSVLITWEEFTGEFKGFSILY